MSMFNPLFADVIVFVITLTGIVYFSSEVCDMTRPRKEKTQAIVILIALFVFLILMGGLVGKDLALM